MVSPKKFTSSSRLYTSQNGGHHENLDITRFDVDSSGSLNFNLDGSMCLSKPGSMRSDKKDDNNNSSSMTEDSGSYLQVIVKKHHTRKEPIHESTVAAQTSPVIASSPKLADQTGDAEQLKEKHKIFGQFDGKNPSIYMMPHPMLLSYQFPQKTLVVDAATSISPPNDEKTKVIDPAEPVVENGKIDGKKLDSFKSIFKGVHWHNKLTPETKRVEKTQVYYFETNSTHLFLSSTDATPVTRLDSINAKADRIATRLWAELFSPFIMLLSFVTNFIVQLQRFLLVGLFRPLFIDTVQTWSDYAFKPLITLIHNALLRPPLLLLQNVLLSLQQALRPLARMLADFMNPINNLVRSFRLVNISKRSSKITKA